MRVIRQKEAIHLTGLSRTSLWRLERAGLFPLRRRIGRHAVGYDCRDIEHWLATRPRGPKSSKQQAA